MSKKGNYETEFLDFDLDERDETHILTVKWSKDIGASLDFAMEVLLTQIWQDVQQYMPKDTGMLISQTNAINETVRLFGGHEVYMFPPGSDYGHYQYEGVVYVDPVTKIAGFMTRDGWKSRWGVKKEPSERKLVYSNPDATPRWAETAIDNHMEEWVDTFKRAL